MSITCAKCTNPKIPRPGPCLCLTGRQNVIGSYCYALDEDLSGTKVKLFINRSKYLSVYRMKFITVSDWVSN